MAFQKLLWAGVLLWTFLMKELSLKCCGETEMGAERKNDKCSKMLTIEGYE